MLEDEWNLPTEDITTPDRKRPDTTVKEADESGDLSALQTAYQDFSEQT